MRDNQCCACEACLQRCPVNCIRIEIDSRGFRYPKIDLNRCTHCGLCDKVCPSIALPAMNASLSSMAARTNDAELLSRSSSGGIFSVLAENVISSGGYVFGAAWDNDWTVHHISCDNIDKLKYLRGSKYVQSSVGNTYRVVEHLLMQGRKVLYSGTPCQIAGLRNFLRKEYSNLIGVDLICHGVCSPYVFKVYLKDLMERLNIKSEKDILSISFRNKSKGWRNFGVCIEYLNQNNFSTHTYYKNLKEDPFLIGFLKNLYLRPICYECPYKGGHSGSDITIGDFWGIRIPSFSDDKGVNSVIVHTEKGRQLMDALHCEKVKCEYQDIFINNRHLEYPAKRNRYSNYFWKKVNKTNFEMLIASIENKEQVLQKIKSIPYKMISNFKRLTRSPNQ